MLKILSFVLLLATVRSQSNLDEVFDQIFGTVPTTGAKQDPAPDPSETAYNENTPCKLRDGREGTCVAFYLCSPINDDSISDDNKNICSSIIDVCCPEDKKLPNPPVKREIQQHNGCGWSNPIGVNLQTQGTAQFGEFPWRVAILNVELVNDKEPEGPKINVFIGTGSLIHPSVVLAAARFVATNKTLKMRAGEWDTQSIKEIYPHQDRDVASIEIHQNYDKDQKLYDIALVFLSKPFDPAPNVGVACLPPANFVQKAGTRCFGTGWGKELTDGRRRYTTLPKKIEFPVIEHDECQERLRKTQLGSLFGLHSSLMCAGGESGKETCWNHGVSSLSCPIESQTDRYIEIGVTAWGLDCEEENNPGVFLDISVLRDWIDVSVSAKNYVPETYTY